MAGVPAPGMPDVVATGKVMATLQDFQLILYVMVVVFIVLVFERLYAGWSMRAERKDMAQERSRLQEEMRLERAKMWEVADKFGSAADKIGDQTDKLVIELQVLRAVAARVESKADAS
jgi:hypothetical protein